MDFEVTAFGAQCRASGRAKEFVGQLVTCGMQVNREAAFRNVGLLAAAFVARGGGSGCRLLARCS